MPARRLVERAVVPQPHGSPPYSYFTVSTFLTQAEFVRGEVRARMGAEKKRRSRKEGAQKPWTLRDPGESLGLRWRSSRVAHSHCPPYPWFSWRNW